MSRSAARSPHSATSSRETPGRRSASAASSAAERPRDPGQFHRPRRERHRASLRPPAGNQTGISLCFVVTDVTIGGATAGARNVISGNTFIGVNVSNSFCGFCVTDIVVQGQLHRHRRDRDPAAGNGAMAIRINTGGNDVIDNVISGNIGDGVVYGSGTAGRRRPWSRATRSAPTPRARCRCRTSAGACASMAERPDRRHGPGRCQHRSPTTERRRRAASSSRAAPCNTIRANSIHDNAGLGIDLFPIGANPNDEATATPGRTTSRTSRSSARDEHARRVAGGRHARPGLPPLQALHDLCSGRLRQRRVRPVSQGLPRRQDVPGIRPGHDGRIRRRSHRRQRASPQRSPASGSA